MEVADTFIPTAGAVGLLPIVTYFFLVVAMLAFLGNFIFVLAIYTKLSADPASVPYRQLPVLVAISTAITGLIYYLMQTYYHGLLAELVTVSDVSDRQTLIREAYNAIGQYRYMGWIITMPLLLLHLLFMFKVQLQTMKRPLAALLMATLFMAFASYIGHQQLSFDNEIQIGQKLVWGLIALIDYVFILFTLNRLWNKFGEPGPWMHHPVFRFTALPILITWGVYLLGYFLTIFPIDFNWIHIVFTLADLASIIGVGLVAYVTTGLKLSADSNGSKN